MSQQGEELAGLAWQFKNVMNLQIKELLVNQYSAYREYGSTYADCIIVDLSTRETLTVVFERTFRADSLQLILDGAFKEDSSAESMNHNNLCIIYDKWLVNGPSELKWKREQAGSWFGVPNVSGGTSYAHIKQLDPWISKDHDQMRHDYLAILGPCKAMEGLCGVIKKKITTRNKQLTNSKKPKSASEIHEIRQAIEKMEGEVRALEKLIGTVKSIVPEVFDDIENEVF